MSYVSFWRRWISLIHKCITRSKLDILVKGSPIIKFRVERELRQGKNHYRFVFFKMDVEGLSVLFKRASTSLPDYSRNPLCKWDIYIYSHLKYADDTLIFIPNYFTLITNSKRILRWFELNLDLKFNFNKSSLVDINLDDEFMIGITNVIYCKWDTLFVRYLSHSLGANPKRLFIWKPVINSIHTRLGSWKESLLSMTRKVSY